MDLLQLGVSIHSFYKFPQIFKPTTQILDATVIMLISLLLLLFYVLTHVTCENSYNM